MIKPHSSTRFFFLAIGCLLFTLSACSANPKIDSGSWQLALTFPTKIRTGDSDFVRLKFSANDLGKLSGEDAAAKNIFDSYHVIAEAKFVAPGLSPDAGELISQTLSEGQTLQFFWKIKPEEAKTYQGTVWFYLRLVDKISGEESRKTVSAQSLEIEAVDLFGFPAGLVRIFGFAGTIFGLWLMYPWLAEKGKMLRFRSKIKRKEYDEHHPNN